MHLEEELLAEPVATVAEALVRVVIAVEIGAVGGEDAEDLVGARTRTKRKNGCQ